MSGTDRASGITLRYLTLDIWHPNCWTLETTSDADGGLVGHGTAIDENGAVGWYTAYGRSRDVVETLVAAVEDSARTDSVRPLAPAASTTLSALGPATTDLLIAFDSEPTIRPAFGTREFIHHGPTRHQDGRERRSFLTPLDRATIADAIEEIEADYDADLEVVRLTTMKPPTGMHGLVDDGLTERQREAFDLARSRGYYDYPRGTTARELAAELSISKTTLLEHLRKAESKLLSAIELR